MIAWNISTTVFEIFPANIFSFRRLPLGLFLLIRSLFENFPLKTFYCAQLSFVGIKIIVRFCVGVQVNLRVRTGFSLKNCLVIVNRDECGKCAENNVQDSCNTIFR